MMRGEQHVVNVVLSPSSWLIVGDDAPLDVAHCETDTIPGFKIRQGRELAVISFMLHARVALDERNLPSILVDNAALCPAVGEMRPPPPTSIGGQRG